MGWLLSQSTGRQAGRQHGEPSGTRQRQLCTAAGPRCRCLHAPGTCTWPVQMAQHIHVLLWTPGKMLSVFMLQRHCGKHMLIALARRHALTTSRSRVALWYVGWSRQGTCVCLGPRGRPSSLAPSSWRTRQAQGNTGRACCHPKQRCASPYPQCSCGGVRMQSETAEGGRSYAMLIGNSHAWLGAGGCAIDAWATPRRG